MATCTEVFNETTLKALASCSLSETQALEIYQQSAEAVVFVLLELTKQLAETRGPQRTPSTPSGMVPGYEKPPAKSRKKRPGAKKSHAGSRRQVPDRIEERQEHRPPCCPDCQAVLMSVFRTLKQRGHDPITTICNAIATCHYSGPYNVVVGPQSGPHKFMSRRKGVL